MGTLKPGNLVGAKSHRFLSERWGLMVLTFCVRIFLWIVNFNYEIKTKINSYIKSKVFKMEELKNEKMAI